MEMNVTTRKTRFTSAMSCEVSALARLNWCPVGGGGSISGHRCGCPGGAAVPGGPGESEEMVGAERRFPCRVGLILSHINCEFALLLLHPSRPREKAWCVQKENGGARGVESSSPGISPPTPRHAGTLSDEPGLRVQQPPVRFAAADTLQLRVCPPLYHLSGA